MMRFFQRTLLVLAFAGVVNSASAFSLLGPFAVDYANTVWEVPALGYNPRGDDIGGVVNLGEEYRWNVKPITYGFDASFLNYFGAKGTAAVMQAMAILNNLPAMSKLSTNLTEYPLDSRRVNYQAMALNLMDLKSITLGLVLQEMGLATPERYVYCLRNRQTHSNPNWTNYVVIERNFDPVTLAPSSYVNGTLYTYSIEEYGPNPSYSDAYETTVDPLAAIYSTTYYWVGLDESVVSAAGQVQGVYLTGLTRDDVGGLRYIYCGSGRWENDNTENLIPGTTVVSGSGGGSSGSGGSSPWSPVGGGGTNSTGTTTTTNAGVNIALRPGVDKITFALGKNDSTFGTFSPITVQYTDTYKTNSTLQTQTTQRVLTQPDIIFQVADLGVDPLSGYPIMVRISGCVSPNWINNSSLNGSAILSGPGQINPTVVIQLSSVGPYIVNENPYFLDQVNPYDVGWVWGSFDGTTNDPVIYPIGTSIQDLEQQVLGGN